MPNLGRLVSRAATHWSQQEALVCGDQRLTYAQLDERSSRLASALTALGLPVGAAVATYAANRAELVEVEVALVKGGFLRVPINFRLGLEEAAHVVEDADVRVVVADPSHASLAVDAVKRSGRDATVVVLDAEGPADTAESVSYEALVAGGDARFDGPDLALDDPCVLNFTSGSTGRLKAAVQTTGNRLANVRKRLMEPGGALTWRDTYLVAGPITHASGMVLLAALSRGAKIVVMPAFTPAEFLALVERERVTTTFMVPTMLNLLLGLPGRDAFDLSSLRSVTIGGAPVSPQRLRDAVDFFGPIVAQGYGQAETTSGVLVLTAEDVVRGIESDPDLLLSCGRALYDTEVMVVDDALRPVPAGTTGELVVRGDDCVTSYWHEPGLSAETFRDGWVLTGDVAWMREDGYVFIVDRLKDMIISGGFNIYCSEVEAAVYEHPDVAEACVVGVPDETWGEAVKAVVVPRPGATVDADALIAFCADRLDRLKKPRSVDVVDALPANRNGKIDRRAVRARYWTGADRAVN
ncbi:AMP-binding protein [Aeromicrobium sp. IC_218]|uniref:AMP-binding protein n=1 Tax=Aeromicrobium sp. IC_218 TaxID=2545468 RepID=UPI001038C765|nr:AMP-binding protein [Aeromicrobium sp. IC_218]TCI99467.1 AMP-dependent synthetase [Aeromicrobium sp. IC_218]